jgi:predicted nucleic acid-binding OB-fold protein
MLKRKVSSWGHQRSIVVLDKKFEFFTQNSIFTEKFEFFDDLVNGIRLIVTNVIGNRIVEKINNILPKIRIFTSRVSNLTILLTLEHP